MSDSLRATVEWQVGRARRLVRGKFERKSLAGEFRIRVADRASGRGSPPMN